MPRQPTRATTLARVEPVFVCLLDSPAFGSKGCRLGLQVVDGQSEAIGIVPQTGNVNGIRIGNDPIGLFGVRVDFGGCVRVGNLAAPGIEARTIGEHHGIHRELPDTVTTQGPGDFNTVTDLNRLGRPSHADHRPDVVGLQLPFFAGSVAHLRANEIAYVGIDEAHFDDLTVERTLPIDIVLGRECVMGLGRTTRQASGDRQCGAILVVQTHGTRPTSIAMLLPRPRCAPSASCAP